MISLLLTIACWFQTVMSAHDYNSCRDNLLNILKKPDAYILELAAKFPQGQVQAELNAFLKTVTDEVGEGHTGQQAVQQVPHLHSCLGGKALWSGKGCTGSVAVV